MDIQKLKENALFINKNNFDLGKIIIEKEKFYKEKKILVEKINEAISILKEYGLIIIKNIIELDIIKKINSLIEEKNKIIKNLLCSYDNTKKFSIYDNNNNIVIESRSDNRFEMKLNLEKEFIKSSLIHNEIISMILNGILESLRIEIDTFSIIRSKNNKLEQHWHTDTTPIFQSFQKNNKLCTPPESIVMITPLIDMCNNLGPTEFLPGTHKWDNDRNFTLNLFNEFLLLNMPNVNTHCSPELNIGDILLFDIRLYHRGGKNKTNISRDLLYISYCPEWYQDRINFKIKNTKKFDDFNDKEKLLLSRVDNINYIRDLENLLIKNNINISELQSKEYDRREFKGIIDLISNSKI